MRSAAASTMLSFLGLCAAVSSVKAADPEVLIHIPLLPFQKNIVAHGIVSAIGYLVLLPLGILLARYTRTFTNKWFHAHWFVQTIVSGPLIIASFALARHATTQAGTGHYNDTHKKWGLAIFILYWIQLAIGVLIHFVKPRFGFRLGGRPLQNYFHAILGLFILAASFYQVRYGFRVEYPLQSGRGKVGNGANIVWWIWVFLIPVVYFAGVALLIRRQYRQEALARDKSVPTATSSGENMAMNAAPGAQATY
ncbi:hypothetical protein EIP91_000378 [Steccherinum ochraceum]|uniref:Cytochrome b561 domain-containing protein n=1 Tax=Steccherinum ochraceum TaxID=92696 RepID=A0A4R0RJA7_9APHY|nr:hypothetical protein EIP91_000378 [Steccherinum ochraceum]